jgi:hypothetical protein
MEKSNFLQMDRAYNIDQAVWLINSTEFTTTINVLNKCFLYGILPFGIVSNLLLFIIYVFKVDSFLPAFHMSHMSVSNVLILTLYSFNIIRIGDHQTTISAYSAFTCKLQAYLFHVSTSFNSWLMFLVDSGLNDYIKTNTECGIKKNKFTKVFAVFAVSAVFFSVDFYSIELVHVNANSLLSKNYSILHQSNTNEIHRMCFIENRNVLICRDVLDFLVSFLIPITLLCTKIYSFSAHLVNVLNKRERFLVSHTGRSTPSLKITLIKFSLSPFIYSSFVLPPYVFTLLDHFFFSISYNSEILKYLFIFWTLLNQIHWSITLYICILYDKSIREFCQKILKFRIKLQRR